MGLDCSHNAFHGAYSAFNSFRQEVAHAIGGSYPTHWKRDDSGKLIQPLQRNESLDDDRWYWGDEGYSQEKNPGLAEFFWLFGISCVNDQSTLKSKFGLSCGVEL